MRQTPNSLFQEALLGRGRGGLTAPEDRRKALEILDEAVTAGARAREVAALLGVGLTTLQRWRRQFAGDGDGLDGRKGSLSADNEVGRLCS